MTNNKVLLSLLFLTIVMISSCGDEEREDPVIDCSQLTGNYSIISEPTCSEGASIQLEGVGGLEPYQYNLFGEFSDSGSFSDLAAGSYTGTIRDANNCEFSGSINI